MREKDGQDVVPTWRPIWIAVLLTVGMNAIIPYTQHRLESISLLEGMIPLGIFPPLPLPALFDQPPPQSLQHDNLPQTL